MSDDYVEETAPVEETPTETIEAEAAPAEAAPVEETPEQVEAKKQEYVNQAINKQHRKFRDEERDHTATKADWAKDKALLAQYQSQEQQHVIPEVPDSFDDDYDSKMAVRDQAIRDSYAYEQN